VVCEEWWEDVVVVRYLASYLVWLRIIRDEDSYLQNVPLFRRFSPHVAKTLFRLRMSLRNQNEFIRGVLELIENISRSCVVGGEKFEDSLV